MWRAEWWALALVLAPALAAQQPDTTLRRYALAEVVIRQDDGPARPLATVQRLTLADLVAIAPATAADAVRLLPGAHLQVNSRGEALVYVRGAAERQVALFLDGIPLNVPWDARFDLSLLPALLLGRVDVVKGPFSALYGPDAAGGAVELATKSLAAPGNLVEVEAAGGLPLQGNAGLSLHHRGARWRVDAGAAALARRGEAVPGGAHLPFSQRGGALRTNTDRAQAGALLRVGRALSARTEMAATVSFAHAEKGVAPESHLDPAQASVRYWRYPVLQFGTLALAADHRFSDRWQARVQAWRTLFAQHIRQYAGVDYDEPLAEQRDGDYTHGARLAAQYAAGGTTARLGFIATTSLHRQRDDEGSAVGALQRYQQHTFSPALDVTQRAGPWTLRAGGGLDVQQTPLTGDKPPLDARQAWNAALGVQRRLGSAFSVRAGASRKTRFPTPRELFGTALNRFLLNPDLRPEQVYAAEVGATFAPHRLQAEAVLFWNRTRDAIDQRTVKVDGKSLRQRVNLEGSYVWGVEATGRARAGGVALEGHATWLRARGIEGDATLPLAEKPALLAYLKAETRLARHLDLLLDVNRIAGAYAAERDGRRPRLPGAWLLGTRVAFQTHFGAAPTTFFVRLDNALDSVLLPQEGLPAAGRAVQAGLRLQR